MHSRNAVAAGTGDFGPLGPALVEEAVGPGTSRARQRADEDVAPDEVSEGLIGNEVVHQPAAPGEVGGVDVGRGRDQGGAKGPSTQWNGSGLPVRRGRKRSRTSSSYSSARRIRAGRSPLKQTLENDDAV